MANIRMQAGTTATIAGVATEAGAPLDPSGAMIEAEIASGSILVATIAGVVTDAAAGAFPIPPDDAVTAAWRQAVSNVVPTTLRRGSYLHLRRMTP